MRDWASDLAPEGALTNLDEVLGKVVQAPLAQNTPLVSLMFDKNERDVQIPDGYVAISISSSERQNLSAYCTRGTHLIAFDTKGKKSQCISRDIMVLSENTHDKIYAQDTSLLLAVRPRDVEALLYAQSNQSLRFVLAASDYDAQGESSEFETSQGTAASSSDAPAQRDLNPSSSQVSAAPAQSSSTSDVSQEVASDSGSTAAHAQTKRGDRTLRTRAIKTKHLPPHSSSSSVSE